MNEAQIGQNVRAIYNKILLRPNNYVCDYFSSRDLSETRNLTHQYSTRIRPSQ